MGGSKNRLPVILFHKICVTIALCSYPQSGFTALHYAAKSWGRDTLPLLLQAGADVNMVTNTGKTPLHFLAHLNYYDTDSVSLLLEAGADVDIADKVQCIRL